jgi:hypothetical protein
MIEPTLLATHVKPAEFIAAASKAVTSTDIEALLAQLPTTPVDDYIFDEENPESGWRPGYFHWIPVGRERGNAGRIKQANLPVNPIAERLVNGMEAIIEMARQRELLASPLTAPPMSPRDAVHRYFGVPALDQLPKLDDSESSKITRGKARELARQLRVRLVFDKVTREFAVAIEDDGIGQTPQLIHRALLSLGSTTKADKWYLWLANCYSAHDSSGFPVLLPFFDAQPGRSFHPFDCRPGSVARSWRGPFRSRGVASPQTPTPDRESLPATSAESIRVGPHLRRLDGALAASNKAATM